MLTEIELKNLEYLSALSFSEKEKQSVLNDLNRIINFVDKIKEIDVDINYNDLERKIDINSLRKDIVKPSMPSEELLYNAPEKENGVFIVPKVVD